MLIERISQDFEKYLAAVAAAPQDDTSDEEWATNHIQKLSEHLEQESDLLTLTPAAQQWLDELPGLMSRRLASA